MQARCYLDDALSRAVQLGMLEEARQLVKRGADPNGMAGGRLPLQRALCRNLEYDAMPMVTMLLDAGADPSRADVVFGGTALHTAALHSVAATRLLLERGADYRIRDKQQRSALFSAALHGCPQTVDLLLGAGANPNDADENGLTPLHVAACNSDPCVARLLLARGANPNVPDEQGNHALHKAAAEGSPATIAALIDGGADVNAPDARGHSPLYVATLSALYSISASDRIAALLKRGADANQKDPQGATAICELASKPHLLLSSHCFLSILGLLLGAGARLPTYRLCPTLRDALCRLCRGCVVDEDTHPVPLSEGCIRQLLRGYTSRLLRKIP